MVLHIIFLIATNCIFHLIICVSIFWHCRQLCLLLNNSCVLYHYLISNVFIIIFHWSNGVLNIFQYSVVHMWLFNMNKLKSFFKELNMHLYHFYNKSCARKDRGFYFHINHWNMLKDVFPVIGIFKCAVFFVKEVKLCHIS